MEQKQARIPHILLGIAGMVEQRMNSLFPPLARDQTVLVRLTRTVQDRLEKLLFQRHPKREWGTFFTFGYRRTAWGLSVSIVDLLPPIHGELDRRSPIVTFHPDYISRMLDVRDQTRLGIGFVHSHPLEWGVVPSSSDDDMDSYFTRVSAPYGSGQPYVSLIFNRTPAGNLEFSGRAFDQQRWFVVEALQSVGDQLRRYRNALIAEPPLPNTTSEDPLARWTSLVGTEVRDNFLSARVGIVGCSGTGSPAVEAFARAQIGRMVLVDGQRIAPSNLERLHGSQASDLRCDPPPYKVSVLKRLIHEINPAAEVTAFVGNILDDEVFDELLRCDLVIGCTDSQHGRAALGDLSALYLVPVIDVGVLPKAQSDRITAQFVDLIRLGAQDPCPFCQGRISIPELNVELMSAEEKRRCRAAAIEATTRGDDGSNYWADEPPQLPSIGYLTTLAGALASGYGLNWLLGTARMPHQRFQFDLNAPEFGFVADTMGADPDCTCSRFRGHSDQGDRSVTRPPHFPPAFRVESESPRELRLQ